MDNLELIKRYLDNRKMKYEISDDDYGSGWKTIYVDRVVYNHTFFNLLGYGIITL